MNLLPKGLKCLLLAVLALFSFNATAATTLYYLHDNQVGTPVVATDQNQQVVWRAQNTPFGDKAGATSSNQIQVPLGFPGQYSDPETGFNYNYYRDYDPSLGRYVESDPTGLGGGLNTYDYVGNTPTGYIDPRGLMEREFCMGDAWETDPMCSPVEEGGGFYSGPTRTGGGNAWGFHDSPPDTPAKAPDPTPKQPKAEPHCPKKLPKSPTGPGKVPKSDRDPKRFFSPSDREAKRSEQGGVCANGCGTNINGSNSAGHHIIRHADGGPTVPENHAEVCINCHKGLHSGE